MIKKLRYLFTLMLLLVASVGWAEEVYYTLTPATGSNNSYTGNCDVAINGITWNVTGNASLTPWRIGGKSLSGIDREVYSKTPMGATISKVELEVGAASSITVNSLKLTIASDANFNNKIDEVTATFAANSTITFAPTSGTSWAKDSYYKITFNVSVSGSSNKFVEFKGAKFYSNTTNPSVATTTTIDASGITNTDVYKGTAAGNLTATVKAGETNIDGATVTWSGNNNNVATIDESGAVTLVAAGTVKFTASYAGVENQYYASSATYEMTVTDTTPFDIEDGFFDFVNATAANEDYGSEIETTTDGNHYESEASTWTAGNVTLVASGKYRWWGNDGTLRFYSYTPNSAMTISVPDGYVITGITITGGQAFEANCGEYKSGKWAGESQEVVLSYTASSGSANVKTVKVDYEVLPAVVAPIINPVSGVVLPGTDVTITVAEGCVISYTTDGSDPVESETAVQTEGNTATVVVNEDMTIKAVAMDGEANISSVATASYTIATIYTVADVLDFFENNNVPETEIYVKGIVSEINSLNTAEYSSARYYISDDGKTTNQFYVYNGKFIDGVDFTADYQLQVGDEVVVCGSLTSYQGTDEFAKNNKITSFNRPVKISAAKYATYITPYDVTFESGVTAYSVTEIGAENITLTEIEGAVRAGSAVVVKADEAKTYTATKTEGASELTGNLLKAVTAVEGLDSSKGNFYILANKSQGVGFYPVTSGTIAKGKGYLEVTDAGAPAKDFYGFGGDETGINDINVNVNANDAIYSISGQRLQKLQRGINIVNGKKIVVK